MHTMEKLRELGATPVEIAYVWEKTGGHADESHVYAALREINPELAERFFKEMRLVVWRSDLKREPFNKRRIVASLLRETNISRGLAERIAREVEEKVRESGLTVITSSFIRELVLARLIEMGLEDIHAQYMRLGVPVYDLQRWLEEHRAEERVLKSIYTQYILLQVLPRRAAELYIEGVWKEEGACRPVVPFASCYISKVPNTRKWVSGLIRYITEHAFVDTPSIYVPAHLYEDIADIVHAIPSAILWSDKEIDGVKHSEKPLFSFGTVESKVVRSLFTINAEKLASIVKTLEEYRELIHIVEEGIQAYTNFKAQLVKRGTDLIRVVGVKRAAEILATEPERILESTRELRVDGVEFI